MSKAKAYCTCDKCGKQFIKTKICFDRQEADEWAEWAERNFDRCPGCYLEDEATREKAREEKLWQMYRKPELKGSDKQVEWAIKLITNAVENLHDVYITKTKCTVREYIDYSKAAIIHFIETHDSASWWIENRSTDAITMMSSAQKEPGFKAYMEATPEYKAAMDYKMAHEQA